jgi:AraC family transcriptional regulator
MINLEGINFDVVDATTCAEPLLVQIAPSDIARRQMTRWTGIGAESVELTRRERFEYGYKAPCHLLIMSERVEREEGETLLDGTPKSSQNKVGQKLSLVPGGHRLCGWQKPRVLDGVTFFYLDPRGPLLDPELHFAETELEPRLHFFDHDLWETARKLKAQAENPGPAQTSYAEALGIVLAHELLRVNGNAPPPVQQFARGGLAGWRRARVADYIEENLANDITLPELAEVADLSPYHFARAFKQSFGLPPHRYMIDRRIKRAKDRLTNPQLSVTQIGQELGFSELSSFTTAFRKRTGVTPSDYRRSLA